MTMVKAMDPADPDLIPEDRKVLEYLESIYGKQTPAGITAKDADSIRAVSGRESAVVTFDLSGWNSPTWGSTYTPVVERTIERAQAWWEKGGIVAGPRIPPQRGEKCSISSCTSTTFTI